MAIQDKVKHLLEAVEYPENFVQSAKDVIAQIKKLKFENRDIFWRGFKSKKIATPVLKVSGEREFFKGAIFKNLKTMIDKLGVKFVSFTTLDAFNARFFGEEMVFVPIKPFRSLQSKEVDDLANLNSKTPEELEEIAKTYENTLEQLSRGEIIFDAKKYLLVKPRQTLFTTRDDVGRRIKSLDQLKKYRDVILLLEDYINHVERGKRNRR